MTEHVRASASSESAFVEYPLRGGTLWLCTVYLVLFAGTVASGVGFLLGLFALLGLVEESAFGTLGAEFDVDGWSRSWMAIDAFVGVAGLGLLTAMAASARRAALRRRLDTAACVDGAPSRVPVAWQRDCYTRDPLAAISTLTYYLVVFFGVMFFVSVVTATVMSVQGDDVALAWGFVAFFAVLTVVALGASVVFLHRNDAAGRAVEVWGEAQVAAASAAASRVEAAGPAGAGGARIDHDADSGSDSGSGSSLRGWLTRNGTRLLLVPMSLSFLVVLVLALVRYRGKRGGTRRFEPGLEATIDAVWRVLLVVGAVTLALGVLGCVLVLLVDASRTAGLWARVSRDELSPRPSQSTLRLVLDGPSLGERVGLAVVSVATIIGWAAWAAVVSAAPDSGALDVAKAWVWASAAAAVVGTGVVAGGLGWERRLRSGVREAWPVSEPAPAPKSS